MVWLVAGSRVMVMFIKSTHTRTHARTHARTNHHHHYHPHTRTHIELDRLIEGGGGGGGAERTIKQTDTT